MGRVIPSISVFGTLEFQHFKVLGDVIRRARVAEGDIQMARLGGEVYSFEDNIVKAPLRNTRLDKGDYPLSSLDALPATALSPA